MSHQPLQQKSSYSSLAGNSMKPNSPGSVCLLFPSRLLPQSFIVKISQHLKTIIAEMGPILTPVHEGVTPDWKASKAICTHLDRGPLCISP